MRFWRVPSQGNRSLVGMYFLPPGVALGQLDSGLNQVLLAHVVTAGRRLARLESFSTVTTTSRPGPLPRRASPSKVRPGYLIARGPNTAMGFVCELGRRPAAG